MHSSRQRIAQVSTLVLVLGLLGFTTHMAFARDGHAASAPADSSQLVSHSPGGHAAGASVTFPTNARGQTYGSAAATAPGNEPDLISAVGKSPSGQIVQGYVSASALNAATPGNAVTTPAQAIAANSEQQSTSIPLYAEDGTTIVGTFTTSPGSMITPSGTQPTTPDSPSQP